MKLRKFADSEEQKMDKKLIISDIDGTLLNEKHQLTEKTIRVIRQLTERGVPLVLASARSPKAMEQLSNRLQLKTPLVCFNGALVMQKTKTRFNPLYSVSLERIDVILVYQLLRQRFPNIQVSIYSNDRWLVEEKNHWVQQEEQIAGISAEVIDVPNFLKEYHPVHKILCMGSENELQLASKELESLDIIGITTAFSKPTYLEIVNNQVSKLASLQFLCQFYGISLKNTVAIGDNYNDMPMLQYAGIGIAMGNAPLTVKEIATLQTTSNKEEGFSKGLANCFGLDIMNEKVF